MTGPKDRSRQVTDARLDRHVGVLTAMLRAYLDHLAQAWQAGPDSASSVASVLAAVGRPVQVDRRVVEEVDAGLAAIAAIDEGPLARVARGLDLSPGEELVVAAAWWSEVDPQLASVFGVLHDDGTRRHPTCGLLHLVTAPYRVAVPVHPRRLVAAGVLDTAGPGDRLGLTPTAREVLSGGPIGAEADDPEQLPDRMAALVGPVTDLLRAGGGAVTIRGVPGSGRRALARAALERLGLVMLGRDRPDSELRLLGRLGIAAPVVDHVDAEGLRWGRRDGPLVILAEPEDPPSAAYEVDLPDPSTAERRGMWAKASRDLGIPADERFVARLADQFHFTEREVEAATRRTLAGAEMARRPPSATDLWAAAQRRPDHRLGRVASRIEPAFSFDDLVLPDAVGEQLRQLVAHMRHRTTVLDDWGFGRRLPRGRGVTALFAGPPGTGKTTAAEAIATELATEVYRVDLSRVMSKYIGETEKNLAVAFREAERTGALLLFDEADALFGKRTEVRDAHDRYANLEVSYLLQRVETFTGLVILSTNKTGNIDDAFLRRLRFVVRFELPGADERAELWRRSFPASASRGALDWSRLARHDLAGGHIQSAAVTAAFLAAGNGGVIDDAHVDRAIRQEYEKLDRAVPAVGGGA